MAPLFRASRSHLAFIRPALHIMRVRFREEAEMATMILNTTGRRDRQSTLHGLHGFRAKIDAFFSDCSQHAVADGSRARLFGFRQSNRVVARNMASSEAGGAGSTHSAPCAGRVEPSPRATTGLVCKIARFVLTASLAFVVLAAVGTLQAAIHVYVWRLVG